MDRKSKPETLHNPETCPCRKKRCPRYRKCEECIANHATKKIKPYCER